MVKAYPLPDSGIKYSYIKMEELTVPLVDYMVD